MLQVWAENKRSHYLDARRGKESCSVGHPLILSASAPWLRESLGLRKEDTSRCASRGSLMMMPASRELSFLSGLSSSPSIANICPIKQADARNTEDTIDLSTLRLSHGRMPPVGHRCGRHPFLPLCLYSQVACRAPVASWFIRLFFVASAPGILSRYQITKKTRLTDTLFFGYTPYGSASFLLSHPVLPAGLEPASRAAASNALSCTQFSRRACL